MPGEVQDSLVCLLSEKVLPIAELENEVLALKGFNIIANDRDRDVDELSSALKRRSNTAVLLPHRHGVPRAARGRHHGPQDQTDSADRQHEHGGSDVGDHPRHVAGGALR